MNIRSGLKAIFGGTKTVVASTWKEVGEYNSLFHPYSTDLYANEVCRSSIRALSEQRAKAAPKCFRRLDTEIKYDDRLQKIIELRPNLYMNGKDFLCKCSNLLEINNTLFIYIQRDEFAKCIGLYPMPKANYEALDYNGRLYIRFKFINSNNIMVVPWDDLAVLRNDYNDSDIFGDTNDAIDTSLSLLDTTNQGMANAIKSTANLRGIVKSSKAMLSDEDVTKLQQRFADAYLTIANTSGVAAIDSTMEFVPINLQPEIANYKHIEELRNNIYRYFGVNDDIIMSKAIPEVWESFYEAKVEPFLVALGQELTYKVYTERERGFGNVILFESNRMQYVSMKTKLDFVQMVDRESMTPNEWREIMGIAPVPWGDKPQSWQNPKVNKTTEVVNDDNEG